MYTIEGENAIVKIQWQGQPADVRLRKLSIKEIGYSLDEFLDTRGGNSTIKVGAMLISLLPKSIIAAPWIEPGKAGNDATLDARIGFQAIMDLREGLFVLNGLEVPIKKEDAPAAAPASG